MPVAQPAQTAMQSTAGIFSGAFGRLDLTPSQSRSWDEGNRAALIERAQRKADREGRTVQVLGRGRTVLATVEPVLQPHQAAWDDVVAVVQDGAAHGGDIANALRDFLGKLSPERLALAVELLSTLSGRVTAEEP